MVAGHTRCLVDGCFGLLKQKFRRSDIFNLQQLEDAVNSSAACNVAQLLAGSGMSWREWDAHLLGHFKPIKGIRKLHHFEFSAQQPGVVVVKESLLDPGKEINILKTSKKAVNDAGLPQVLEPPGLTLERAQYLYKQIRQHVPPAFQDDLCPCPEGQAPAAEGEGADDDMDEG